MVNNVDDNSIINKTNKKNKKKKNTGDEGIIKIDFTPSVIDESNDEKVFLKKKELREQYDMKKEEYVQIKKKLMLPEYADDKNLHNKKKKLKKELKSMKEQYKSEKV